VKTAMTANVRALSSNRAAYRKSVSRVLISYSSSRSDEALWLRSFRLVIGVDSSLARSVDE
jgi:hypothetical protein